MSTWIALILVLSVALFCLCVYQLADDWMRNKFDAFNPKNFFLAYLALQLAIYPFYVIVSGGSFRIFDNGSEADLKWIVAALILSCVGVFSFQFGYFFGGRINFFNQSFANRGIDAERVAAVLFFGLPVSLVSIYYAYFRLGGLGGYFESFVEVRYGGSTGGAFIGFFATSFVAYLGVLSFICSVRSPSRRTWLRVSAALHVLALVTTLMTGFRILLGPMLLIIVSSYHYYIRSLRRVEVMLFLLSLTTLMTAYGVIRSRVEAHLSLSGINENDQVSIIDSFFTRSPGIELVAQTMKKIDEGEDFAYFVAGAWEALTIIVPRNWWTEKPTPQSLLFGERFMSYELFLRDGTVTTNTGGHSPTAIGFCYWQGGWWFVILGMFILGIAFSGSYRLFVMNRHNQPFALVYIIIASGMFKFAEAPQDTVNGILLTVPILIVFISFCSSKNPMRIAASGSHRRAYPLSN